MELFGIGVLARRAGIAASTIRYYERIGLLPPAKRVNTKRRYSADILQTLNVIRMAQQAGFTISEIHMLLHNFPDDTPPSERWEALATKKIIELDALLHRVQTMKSLLTQTLQCQCSSIDECPRGVLNNADMTANSQQENAIHILKIQHSLS